MTSAQETPEFWKITTTAVEDAVKVFFSPLRSLWSLLSLGIGDEPLLDKIQYLEREVGALKASAAGSVVLRLNKHSESVPSASKDQMHAARSENRSGGIISYYGNRRIETFVERTPEGQYKVRNVRAALKSQADAIQKAREQRGAFNVPSGPKRPFQVEADERSKRGR